MFNLHNFVEKIIANNKHRKFLQGILVLSGISSLLSIFLLLGIYLNPDIFYILNKSEPEINVVDTSSHPFILFNKSDIPSIKNKISNSSYLQSIYQQTAVRKGLTSELRDLDLVQHSFRWLTMGDTASKQIALETVNYYIQGEHRFNFQGYTTQTKNYGTGETCSSLAIAYDWLYDDLSASQKQALKDLLTEWGSGMYGVYTPDPSAAGGNFNTSMFGCLGLIGLALTNDGVSGSNQWLDFAKNSLTQYYFQQVFNPQGDYEAGPGYFTYGAAPAYLFASGYERVKGTNIIESTNASRIWNYATYALMSNKIYPKYGDNNFTLLQGHLLYLLQPLIQSQNVRVPGYLWVWQNTNNSNFIYFREFDNISTILWYPINIEPKSPDTITSFSPSFIFYSQPDTHGGTSTPGGMVALRNGWADNNNITFWLNNRWRWQGHTHYDPNHFLLSAYGEELFTDNNGWTYANPIRGKLSQQNTILIDKDVINSDMPTSGFVTGTSPALGMFTDFVQNQAADMLRSDSKYPHNDWSDQPNLQKKTADGTNSYTNYWGAVPADVIPYKQADRIAILAKDLLNLPYIVMFDLFNANGTNVEIDKTHMYTWQAHIPLSATSMRGNGSADSPFLMQNGEAELKAFWLSPNTMQFTILPKEEKRNDKAIQLTQNQVIKGQFLSLLIPGKIGQTQTTQANVIQNNNPMIVEFYDNVRKNIIIANPQQTLVSYQGISTDAVLAIIEVNKSNNKVIKYVLYQAKKLTQSGQTYLDSQIASSLVNTIDTPQPTNPPAPTATASPTTTPRPTSTAHPTNTPAPTSSPTNVPNPTATATPTATPGTGGITFSCTGNSFSNATLCSHDGDNLTINTPKALVFSCTADRKCEYVCNNGYVFSNGSCNLTSSPSPGSNYSCVGTVPAHSQACPGYHDGLTMDMSILLLDSCSGNVTCVYTCNSGYHRVNQQCVANTNPTSTAIPTSTPTITPTPTPTPNNQSQTTYACYDRCQYDSQCNNSLLCRSVDGTNRCINIECPKESDCSCSPTTPKEPGLPQAGYMPASLRIILLLSVLGLVGTAAFMFKRKRG